MKRFHKDAGYQACSGGFVIDLDGRPVRTPAKALLIAPTEKMACRICDEWRRMEDVIDHEKMPITRFLNSSIDVVAGRRAAVIDELAAFGQTDLLCYRAESPQDLVEAESTYWDPPLRWLSEAHGVHLQTQIGIRPIRQDKHALAALTELIGSLDNYRIAGLHTATTISGSIVLGLARLLDAIDTDALWTAAMVNENYQNALWGEDPEEQKRRERLKGELADMENWLSLL